MRRDTVKVECLLLLFSLALRLLPAKAHALALAAERLLALSALVLGGSGAASIGGPTALVPEEGIALAQLLLARGGRVHLLHGVGVNPGVVDGRR